MNVGSFLAAVERLPIGSLADIVQMQPFLVVAPHPDDETLGCAGLIAEAVARGVRCRVVVVTDGTASHPNSATYPPARLHALRRAESLEAAVVCGLTPEDVTFLDLPDTGLPSDEGLCTRAIEGIAAAAQGVGAKSAFVTWRHDPHCDHEIVHDLTRQATDRLGIRQWSYPIWGWTLPPEAPLEARAPEGYRLNIDRWVDVKRHAIACHASQTSRLIADDPQGFMLMPDVLARFHEPIEYFLKA